MILYLKQERKIKRLSAGWAVDAGEPLLANLYDILGEKNVKVVQKNIEKNSKMH